jgi:RNA polymerase sigma-54 factor
MFPLKYFFSDKIANSQGTEISTREIKQKLREVIEQEDKTNPVTDDQLVEIMHESGYPIARRTVAKYREQMEIPVARLRRQMF